MRLYIYSQHHPSAGREVPSDVLDQYENPDHSDDWFTVEGNSDSLRKYARREMTASKTAGAGTDLYRRHVAKTILNAI